MNGRNDGKIRCYVFYLEIEEKAFYEKLSKFIFASTEKLVRKDLVDQLLMADNQRRLRLWGFGVVFSDVFGMISFEFWW